MLKTKISLILMVLLLSSCRRVEPILETPNTAVVFDLDVSASHNFDSTKVRMYLDGIINEHLKQNGDCFLLIYAGNTGFDVSQSRTHVLSLPESNLEGQNKIEALRSEKSVQEVLAKEQSAILNLLMSDISIARNDQETHLLASLATVNELLGTVQSHDVHLYILSDFIEDSELRHFHNQALLSQSQATEFAKEDVKVLKATYELGQLNRVQEVTLITQNCLGDVVLKRQDFGFILGYWKAVLIGLMLDNAHLETICP